MTVRGGGANIYYTSWVPSSTISPHYYYQPANWWIRNSREQNIIWRLQWEEATVCWMDHKNNNLMLCIISLSFFLSTTRMVLLHLHIKSTGLLSAIRWFNRWDQESASSFVLWTRTKEDTESEWLVLDHAITEALVIGLTIITTIDLLAGASYAILLSEKTIREWTLHTSRGGCSGDVRK